MKKYLLQLVFLIVAAAVYGQSKTHFIYKGNENFEHSDFANACANYKFALSDSITMRSLVYPYEVQVTNQKLPKTSVVVDSTTTVTMKQYLDHQIAWCYMEMKDYPRSEIHFRSTANEAAYPHDLYYFGLALMNNQKYDTAITVLEQYIRSEKATDELSHAAKVAITGCHFAMEKAGEDKETRVFLTDTAVFHRGTSNFAAMYFNNDRSLMFTSARPGGVILEEEQNSAYLLDLYYTELNENGSWNPATNFGRPLNSAQHDAASSFNNNNVIFYTRWNDEKRDQQHIYLARLLNMKFYEAYKLDSAVNVPGYKSIQPFVSMDGKTLFFSSNRPGGFGGMDIWKIAIDSSGNVQGQAENLGALVNSDQDEVTPFFHEVSSTLFFSSRGHGGIGGLDIFKSYFDRETGSYQLPVNMGEPINSSKDDAYMIWDTRLSRGYLSSDREPCDGGSCYAIYEVNNEPIHIYLSGYSYDKETEEILPNCKLTFKDVKGESPSFTLMTDENGYYSKELSYGQEWFIKCQKQNYFADATSVNTNYITETTSITRDFYLNPIPQQEIEIDGIEYDFNSANLRPQSKQILDKLVEFLELDNDIRIEINSHTDARGSDVYNLDLSQRRAKSCVDYLITQGIDPNRLIPIGYGETQPNTVQDPKTKKPVLDEAGKPILLTEAYIDAKKTKKEREELHQRNRRTSFKVVASGLD